MCCTVFKQMLLKKSTLIIVALLLFAFQSNAQNYWWNQRTAYEIFVRSFYDSNRDGKGDFNGLNQKLDYLNDGNPNTNTDLGIGLVWLMPINASPSEHGYDVTDYKKVNPTYGTMNDFKTMLDSAHRRGINVIMDFVINHTSSQHPWFVKSAANDPFYRNFYRWQTPAPTQTGPWGQQVWYPKNGSNYYALFWSEMPDLNYNYPPVKDSIFSAAKFWLKEVGVDGFRLDAVMYLYENGNTLKNDPATISFLKEFNDSCEVWKKESLLIGEVWDSPQSIALYTGKLDMCFDFNLAASNINTVTNVDPTYGQQFLNNAQLTLDTNQYGNFLTNHDQNRIFDELGNDINKNKLAASLYLTQPGVPFIYYGEEVAMKGSKPDQYIRTPMQWSASAYAGFTTGTPWIRVNTNFSTYNVAVMQSDSNSLWNHYRKLIHIRNAETVLQMGSVKNISSSSASVHSYQRTYANEDILVLNNISSSYLPNVQFSFSKTDGNAGTYAAYDLWSDSVFVISSATKIYNAQVNLKPYQTRIIKLLPYTGISVEDESSLVLYPNPVQDELNINYVTKSGFEIRIYNSIGELMLSEKVNADALHRVYFQFPSGLYTIQLYTEKGIINRKIIKP